MRSLWILIGRFFCSHNYEQTRINFNWMNLKSIKRSCITLVMSISKNMCFLKDRTPSHAYILRGVRCPARLLFFSVRGLNTYKKDYLQLFNLVDLVFNLKQWLDLNGLNWSADMKSSWGSKPFSLLIVL